MVVSKNFYIGFRSVDENMCIKDSEILNLFADMAGIHSKSVNRGFNDVDFRWLLVGYKVEVLERPKFESMVEVFTWSRGIKNAIAAREFEIRDMDGKLLVKALSNFVKVNADTHKIERISEEDLDAYESEPAHTNFGEIKLQRLKEPDCYEWQDEMLIDWKWMDLNHHMNNSYYMEIATHMLPVEVKQNGSISSFEIMYKQQILENTYVNCCFAETEDAYIVCFKNKETELLHSVVNFYKEKK